jgi:DNA-binding MarR family transcriptional regulator
MPERSKRNPQRGADESKNVSAFLSPTELADRPGYLIRRLHQISVAIFLDASKQFDVTPIQYGAIHVIGVMPGIDQSRLKQLLGLDRQTISNVVQRLMDKKLIAREPKDGRSFALFTTGTANALMEAMQRPLASIDERLMQPLDDDEKSEFMRLIRKLVAENNDLSRAPMNG